MVFHSSSSTQTSLYLVICWSFRSKQAQKVSKLPGKTCNSDGEIIRHCDAPFSGVGTWHRRQLKAVAPRSLGGARVPSIAVEGTGT